MKAPAIAFAAWSLACGTTAEPARPAAQAGQPASAGGAESSSGSGGVAGGSVAGSVTGGVSGAGAASSASGAAGATAVAGASGGGGSGPAPQSFQCPDEEFEVPAPGEPRPICEGFQFGRDFNEGPTWIDGSFYFSNFALRARGGDVSGDLIKYTPGGDCEIFIPDVGTNGLAPSLDGNLLAVSHKSRALIEFDLATKAPTILSDAYMGQLFDSPNDLVQHSTGTIYFTNATHELGEREPGIGPALFMRDPGGVLTLLHQGSPQPNGIAMSPQQDRLYVVNGGLWDLDESGLPSNQRDFPLQADGIGTDCAGNVYLSGGAILDPDGEQIAEYAGGTNLAFGGIDGKTMLVVGWGQEVNIIETNVPGFP